MSYPYPATPIVSLTVNTKAIVVSNYLYIDGGEFTTWNDTGNGVQDGSGIQLLNSCNGADTCGGNITTLPGICDSINLIRSM